MKRRHGLNPHEELETRIGTKRSKNWKVTACKH